MKTKIFLQTLYISLLLCSFIQAQDNQNVLNAPTIPAGKDKIFSLPLIPQDNLQIYHQYGLSIQLSQPNRTVPISVNMRSSGLWVNNYTEWSYKGLNFHCEASQTCKSQGSAQYSWIEEVGWNKPQVILSGELVKERVDLGGIILPNADVLIANEISEDYMQWRVKGALGLNFRRSDPKVPTFFEYLKTEGLVDQSIFSIYLNKSNDGELMFGGYDSKRAESEFQYVKWQEDEDLELPGFSFQAKGIGYGNTILSEDYTVVIDFEHPNIMVPEWIIERIYQEERTRGLSHIKLYCKAVPFLQDIVIEFEGMTLRIPPAAYTRYGDVVYYDSDTGKEMHETSCEQSLTATEGSKPKIILGRAFLKFFYTVFNHEEKTVGFSAMTSLLKEYPFSEAAGDYPVLHYYLPLKVGGAIAVLVIAKFCVILYFIRKAWKGPDSSDSEKLVPPKIDVGIPVYLGANNNGHQEENHQQESQNIDVGKITIEEEEKFYA